MKLLLAGEGRHELGDWIELPQYREAPPKPGVLLALLERVDATSSWQIVAGCQWKKIRKYRAGDHNAPETRTILGLMLLAQSLRCEAFVFSRDRDGKRNSDRQRDVDRGLEEVDDRHERDPCAPQAVGGMAIEELEAWILALSGVRNTEAMTGPASEMANRLGGSDLDRMIEVVEAADLRAIPDDARSLLDWLARARNVLAPD